MLSRNCFLLFALLAFLLVSNAAAATYTVDRSDDVTAAACTASANDCSLRGAISNANANGPGTDTINFNVGGGNFQTINITLEIPSITSSLTIDGTTQPLWGGLPLIEISGLGAVAANSDGFNIASPVTGETINVTIKSLVINRFTGNGVYSHCANGCNVSVVGSYIGVNGGGSVDLGNGSNGIKIDAYPGSAFNIGGTATSERNVISGNQGDGIFIGVALNFQSADTQITVLNSFIGLGAGGSADVGNSGSGITFAGAGFGYMLQVGNGLANGRNIISGNDADGIFANTGTLTIIGNYIGSNFIGNADLGNTLNGIELIDGVGDATIGGTVLGVGVGNVISGNNEAGISISDASISATIRRNLIGTNAAGTTALGNSNGGIFLYENDTFTDSSITIGSDTNAADGNTISGNGGDGIEIDAKVRQVKMYANKIGTNDAATALIPNSNVGIRVGSSQNEIGLAGNNIASNVVSGNQSGIFLVGINANGNKVYNNFIGTNTAGSNLGNVGTGIYINQGALGNLIGNASASGGNRIAFNGDDGVNVANGSLNTIRGNSIYSNGSLGIDLQADDVTNNDPGDLDAGPNSLQNFPVLVNASPVQLYGNLSSTPNAAFFLDFYRVDSCDASGHGEGRYYLGSKTVGVTNNGTGVFNYFDIPLTVGQIITATATDQNGNTSEFSQCLTVNPPPGALSFSAATYSANESSGNRTIVVNRTGGSFGTIQVNYATSNGTAAAGQDYTTQSGTMIFFDGEVVKTFDIPINNDLLDETDETVNLTLSFPTNGSFLTNPNTAVMTIVDNDAPPSISIEDVTHKEGNIGALQFSFRVSLSAPSGLPVSVDFGTTDGTATVNSDYLPNSGQVNFAPGETLKNILVAVNGDLTTELNETFFVNLSNPANAVLADDQAVGTIVDDDNPGRFSFSLAPYSGTEHQQVLVTVTRTNGDAGTVSVDYATAGGTATPFTDYTPATGSLIFGDGETVKTFGVTIVDDLAPEPVETLNVVLSNPIGGATIGVPAVAAINIIDNDSGTLLKIEGEIKKPDNTPLTGAVVNLTGTQNAAAATDSNGHYSFAELAPGGNYSVAPAAIGFTFDPLNRQYLTMSGDITNANFNATAAPSRQLRIIGGDTHPGQNVNVVVEMVAQGDENSAGFSLNFDPAILSNPQAVLGADSLSAMLITNDAGAGKYGVLLALPAGQSFVAGTKSLVTITFATAATQVYSSPITFGNLPIAKSVANTNADPLPANYLDGAVTFAQGYEADVTPRPTGKNNGSLLITDFTQVGRFVAGLDTVNPLFNEFQRADCAPRVSLGNGVLDVADFTQAGRYVAAIDAVNQAGGQKLSGLARFDDEGQAAKGLFLVPTTVRVVNLDANPGQQVFVTIAADAQGTENGFGFTLNYDISRLSAPLVTKGADTQNATLIPNLLQPGKVGVVLGLPFGEALPAGPRHLVTIRFNVAANAPGGQTPLTFGDSPVTRAVSDVDANSLPSNFQDGAVNILAPTAATASVAGRVTDTSGRAISRARVTISGPGGPIGYAMTNAFGYYRFANMPVGDTYVISVDHKSFQFAIASQIFTLFEDTETVDFTGSIGE